ncbi:hypothetical protein SAMN05446935_7657 [Burkholderia sp. YR290]|nr:hypothetical protein SAMN05446935_7657 [Burkholderia sp. YR290]
MMADFLTRLAERTLGTRPVIRPDIAPAIGPAPTIDSPARPSPDGEESFAAAAMIPPVLQCMERQPLAAERPVLDQLAAVAATKAESRPPESVATHPHSKPRAREPALDDEGVLPLPMPAHVNAQSMQGSQRSQGLQRSQSIGEPSLQRGQFAAPAIHVAISPQTRVAASTAVPKSEAPNRVDSQASAVHVTIGRVEVRAIMPPSVPPQPLPDRKGSANLSLGAYLQERNRGRR